MSGTIFCIGRNYVAHAAELGNAVPTEPLVFLKAPATRRGLESAPVAFADETFHHELELVVRLGREVPLGALGTWDDIDAVTVGIDVTRRGNQRDCKERRVPWTTAKSFAGSAVLAPFVDRSQLAGPPFAFTLRVHDELRQSGHTSNMIFDVPTLLTHLATLVPLSPGDLVFTGTPEGVGPLRVGDAFTLTLADEQDTSYRWNGRF